MIIDMVGALALQAVEPTSALCELNWTQRGRRWTAAITCPTDVPDAAILQSAANAVLSPRRLRVEIYSRPRDSQVEFVLGQNGWDLGQITQIHRAPPSFPPIAFERNRTAHCRGAIQLRANGRRQSDEWECRSQNDQGRAEGSGPFIRASRDAIGESYWIVPLSDTTPCVETDFKFQIQFGEVSVTAPEFPASEGPQCPE